jgi:2-polyprenyl-3-methyl-5-hydroxy-6-metoxy-1,4-benzoquinol methylase
LKTRFPQPDASFDGILCWDVLDYLDKASAPIVAREMVRLLKPGGALLGFFATVALPAAEYVRYVIVDDLTLRHRVYPAARPRQQVFVNRDINRMFEGLTVSDSYLLLTKTREMVFRKPEKKTAGPG